MNETRLFRNVCVYLPVDRADYPQKSSFFSNTALKFRHLAYLWDSQPKDFGIMSVFPLHSHNESQRDALFLKFI